MYFYQGYNLVWVTEYSFRMLKQLISGRCVYVAGEAKSLRSLLWYLLLYVLVNTWTQNRSYVTCVAECACVSDLIVLTGVRVFVSRFQDNKGWRKGRGNRELVLNWHPQECSRLISIIFCSMVVAFAYFASPMYCR